MGSQQMLTWAEYLRCCQSIHEKELEKVLEKEPRLWPFWVTVHIYVELTTT